MDLNNDCTIAPLNKHIFILCGPPLSGKSTYAKTLTKHWESAKVVSKDDIRHKYKLLHYDVEDERKVSDIYQTKLELLELVPTIDLIILDNHHCSQNQLSKLIIKYNTKDYKVSLKSIDAPLLTLFWRNFVRFFETGRWVKPSVILRFYKAFKKIDFNHFNHYLIN